eukprot:1349676-Rhodomonas_salina.6
MLSNPQLTWFLSVVSSLLRAGTEWETVPILFKTTNSKGLVLKKGCWYENRAGVAAMTRAAPKTKKKKAATSSAAAAVQDAAPASAS